MPVTIDAAGRAAPDDEAALADLRSRYLANQAELYRVDPELAQRLDETPFAELEALSAARDGALTVRCLADDGEALWLHSRYRPLEEAQALVDAHRPSEQTAFVLCGLGLGHHLAALEQRWERPLVLVVENNLRRIKLALCVTDLSAALAQRRLIILHRDDKGHIHQRLMPHMAALMLGLTILQTPQARRCAVAFQAHALELLTEFVSYSRLQMVTLLKVSRTTFRNVAGNVSAYLDSGDIAALRDAARGYPAILVAAGPSLGRQLAQVQSLRDRAVIIAVQTVFKLMHATGTLPHFVTALDYHETSAGFFEGVEDVGDCMLVAEPKVTWHVPELYPGRRIVLANRLYERLLGEHAPRRGGLKPGSTVAHLSLYLAQHLGCDPIILVGQDLCFSEGLFYPPGTPIERAWEPELGRFQTLENKQWERIVRNRGILRRVQDVQGRSVYTDGLLYSYAEQFQADFAASSNRIIQAGAAGMRLAGAEVMTLESAASEFCTRLLPPDLFVLPEASAPAASVVISALEQRLADLREAREIARQMQSVLEELSGLLDRPSAFNRLLGRVDDLRLRMHRHEAVYGLVLEVSQQAELKRFSADRRLGRVEQETADSARRRLQRDRAYVADFIEGCDFLLGALPEALQRVRTRGSHD